MKHITGKWIYTIGGIPSCPICGKRDKVIGIDGAYECGRCDISPTKYVANMQARISELEAENAIFRNADYDALQCGSRIAELEAENAKLKEALESSARKLKELGSEYENCPPQHDCPSDLGLGCQQCWLDWLRGAK